MGDWAGRSWQRHVHRVGVPAEIVSRLEEADVGQPAQGMGGAQSCNA